MGLVLLLPVRCFGILICLLLHRVGGRALFGLLRLGVEVGGISGVEVGGDGISGFEVFGGGISGVGGGVIALVVDAVAFVLLDRV